jgi:hypothetical protein
MDFVEVEVLEARACAMSRGWVASSEELAHSLSTLAVEMPDRCAKIIELSISRSAKMLNFRAAFLAANPDRTSIFGMK